MDGVILLHGLARGSHAMRHLERAARETGYRTLALDYPSRHSPIAQLAQGLRDPVARFASGCETVHFVAHSMGGLVTRSLLRSSRPRNLGSVVTLATPHLGSEVAEFLLKFPPTASFYGPALRDLRLLTDEESRAKFGEIDYSLGCVAGESIHNPFFGYLLLSRPNDGTVAASRARVRGAAGYLSLDVNHTSILWNRSAIRQTLYFLREGRFEPADQHMATR